MRRESATLLREGRARAPRTQFTAFEWTASTEEGRTPSSAQPRVSAAFAALADEGVRPSSHSHRNFIDGSPNRIHDFFTSGSFTTAFARWHASPIVIELEPKSWRNISAFITAC